MKTFFFDSIYNTQEFALKELSSEPIFVTSFSQEKGKGTSNREWLNADQAIACSLALFEEHIKISHTLIPLVAGFAFVKVFQDIDLTLKWPNDIILNEKKDKHVSFFAKNRQKNNIVRVYNVKNRTSKAASSSRRLARVLRY